jgi:mono/diheme cytochrome c family protein
VRPGLGIAALAIAAAAAGCGSGGGSRRADGPPRATAAATLFTENCAVCHSLNGHPSPHQQGGDLLRVQMTRAEMLEFVSEMPVPHRLSTTQQEAVADYVRSIEARGS